MLYKILTLALLLASQTNAVPWNENLRWSLDLSSRARINRTNDLATFGFIGLDMHKVISTRSRDLVTLTLQPYLTRVDNLKPTPPIFDGPDDWELVWRIFNANIKILQNGALNLRLGHLEIPFGLEHPISTNGTLRDFQHGKNFGVKADWGVSVNGDLGANEYEIAWSSGSGNKLREGGGVVSGRIGSDRDANLVYGLSFLNGKFVNGQERRRFGVDIQWYARAFGLLGEVSFGKDKPTKGIRRFIGELNWRNGDETIFAWLQLLANEEQEMDDLSIKVGAEYGAWRRFALSAQYVQQLKDPTGSELGRSLLAQLRYRY